MMVHNMSTTDAIKAISIDINWDLFLRPASPGLYGHADPKAQVRWAHELGANVMQTFCCSYNGLAWFPSDIAPRTPGLRGNFLQDQVEEGHRLGMRIMGYFCLGSNPCWAYSHESHGWHEFKHGDASGPPFHPRGKNADWSWIPFTNDYLEYFCRCLREALVKTEIDGFMIDWFKVERGPDWLDCEKNMWSELMDEPFPDRGEPSADAEIEFKRRQVERAWVRIRQTVKETRPSAVIWTNHPFARTDDPLWNGHRLLKEVDWLLNESPRIEFLDWLKANTGPHTRLVQTLCGWLDHAACNWRELHGEGLGLYGFTKVNPGTCLPWTVAEARALRSKAMGPGLLDHVIADAKNIAILREAYGSL